MYDTRQRKSLQPREGAAALSHNVTVLRSFTRGPTIAGSDPERNPMSTRLCLVLCLVAAACGNKSSSNPECPAPLKANSEACTDHTECCSGLCGTDGTCAESSGQCVAAGGTCVSSADCCSGQCGDDGSGAFTCGAGFGACEPLTQPCDTANDCCSLGCHGGKCDDAICATGGQMCGADSDCCSNSCSAAGTCEVPSGCFQAGETCDANSKCCSGNCV